MTAPIDPIRHRIVLVDDHAVIRGGLARLIATRADLELVGQAATARDALDVVGAVQPDLVLLDIDLGEDSSLDIIPQLRDHPHQPLVLILSMHDDLAHVEAAFAAGASGYALKDAAETDLPDAIAAVVRGERYVQPTLGGTQR